MSISDPGYPDDIRQYDNDPRSPFYNEDSHNGPSPEDMADMHREQEQDRMEDR